jgi:polyhydroxyalkanoate synthesis regulator phasin
MAQPKRSTSSSAAKRRPAARRRPSSADAAVEAAESNLAQGLSTLRDAISRLAPGNVVVLSRDRLQEVLEDAVRRGRMTRGDAEALMRGLVSHGRKQTEGVLGEIEQLLEHGRKQLEDARKRADSAASRLRRTPPGDRVVRAADRARRTVGVGPSFPILGYDDLTAAQVADRLGELSPPQLRKVRDYERRHANRKSVLEAIERRLG